MPMGAPAASEVKRSPGLIDIPQASSCLPFMDSIGLPALPKPNLRLLSVEECNLSCSYCHFRTSLHGRARMSAAVAIHSVRAFAAAATRRQLRNCEVSLYGGEPLLNPPVLDALLLEASRLREQEFELTLILNTNGTLLTRERARRLAAASARVHLSLDGVDEAANACRVNLAGKATLSAALRAIEHLRNAGCVFQINSILTPANQDTFRPLIDFCRVCGAERVFLALPDTAVASGQGIAAPNYPWRLLNVAAWAERQGVELTGPWGVGLHDTSRRQAWPPLNLVVRCDGRAFFPHVPHRLLASVEAALESEAGLAVEQEWLAIVDTCGGCELLERCHGYLKMMVYYHASHEGSAQLQCNLARDVAALARSRRFQSLVTPLDLEIRGAEDGDLEIRNPVVPESTVIASRDTLEVLNWFRRGATFASLEQAYSAPNLQAVCDTLIERNLLVPPAANSDLVWLESLTGTGTVRNAGRFIIGAKSPADLDRLSILLPHLVAAAERLPERLRHRKTRFCIYAASGRSSMAAALRCAPEDGVLAWLAGTVLNSVIILNLELCLGIVTHAGKRQRQEFAQGLTHEFCHSALRLAGIRVPLWLEEGLCQEIAGNQSEPDRLALASLRLHDFMSFVAESPNAGLLSFDATPVDENPAYVLAQDFVHFFDRRVGLDHFLEEFERAGLAALVSPFPLAGSQVEPFSLSLEQTLDAWKTDLTARVSARRTWEKPLRLFVSGAKAAVYNRMVGGLVTVEKPPMAMLDSLVDRNLTLEDISGLIGGMDGSKTDLLRRNAGVFRPRRGYHLRLALDNGCNMRCSYCYEAPQPPQPMSMEIADRAVAVWRDLLRARDVAHSSIRFFGGEPFLNWPVMKHVLTTATDGLAADAVEWTVNTNGTLLQTEQITALGEKGDRLLVVLSCDGVGARNDQARRLRGGQGSFGLVDHAARGLAEAGIRLCIAAVLGSHNVDGLPDLIRYVSALRHQYGSTVYLSLDLMIGPRLSPDAETKIERSYLEALAICEQESQPVSGKTFRAFESLVQSEGATGHFCAITGTELSVTAEGNLRLCHAIRDSDYASLAEVPTGEEIPLPEYVRRRAGGEIEACRDCEVEGLCAGGCLAQASSGSVSGQGNPDPLFCRLMKATFRRSLETTLHCEL